MNNATASTAESEKDFRADAAGWQQRWTMEFSAARKEIKKWQKQGRKIVKRYLDERDGRTEQETRWNLFPSNVDTLESLLYGKSPSVDVTRRFADSQDDLARVSANILQRLLNGDLERNSDGYSSALEYALQDRLIPGMGNVRLRYVCEMETVPAQPAQTEQYVDEQGQPQTRELAPAVPEHERKAHEDVETEHVYWEDQLWSPARTFHLVRWWAFKTPMTRDELVRRFGEKVGRLVPLNQKKGSGQTSSGGGYGSSAEIDAEKQDPWGRADVWEVWDREHLKVFWVVESMDRVLDVEPDPLELEGFWPFPRPMVAHATTSKLIPRPDFVLGQDLYDEVDAISTRINRIQRAIRVAGCYDKTAGALQRLLTEGTENELIPVENWAMFDQKGKLEGAIAWLPLSTLVEALGVLRDYRSELVNAVFQITGMSDIMRGEAQQTATATEQAIKARFGSVRVQRLQDDFARFASDVQRIRGEIICKHFDAETILARSNIGNTPDAAMAQQAVEFLKSDFACYRIQVKPESVSLTDFAALKQERTDVIQTVGAYIQMVQPLAAQAPATAPFLLQILQWLMAGLRGGATPEAILEQAIAAVKQQQMAAAQQPPQPPPPDPKVMQQHLKNQGEMAKTAMHSQARMGEIAAETKAAVVERATDAHFSILEQEAKQRHDALAAVERVTRPQPGGP